MNILRKIVSFVVLVAAVVVLVGVCMKYDWDGFAAVFKDFSFDALVSEIYLFFAVAGNAIVLTMLGFIGLTMPSPKKK
ncbi:MAG: hypothetical protein NC133_01425 [Prevotella sp.]|nr:hypothetical protein [Prevotella sp.]